MIYPMTTESETVPSTGGAATNDDLLELKAIHPTSDVEYLLGHDVPTLLLGMYVSRDIYNRGLASDGRIPVDLDSKVELVREILTLRARYQTLDWPIRSHMKVGHASETIRAKLSVAE